MKSIRNSRFYVIAAISINFVFESYGYSYSTIHYDTAKLYYKQSERIIKFNESDFHLEMRICGINAKCIQRVTLAHPSRLWKPKKKNIGRRSPLDCSYSLNAYSATAHHNYISYDFQLKQHKCHDFSSIGGGSTFDIFANTSNSIAYCQYTDNHDNSYNISCPFFHVKGDFRYCISVTILLSHEHYDNYGECMMDWSAKISELRYVILNNKRFCFNLNEIFEKSHYHNQHHIANEYLEETPDELVKLSVPDMVNIYSGIWVTNDVISQINFTYCSSFQSCESYPRNHFAELSKEEMYVSKFHLELELGTAISSYEYLMKNNMTINFMELSASKPLIFPSLINVSEIEMMSKFPFVPVIKNVNGNVTVNRYIASSVRDYETDKTDLLKHNRKYVYIGSSHMRYAYDALIRYFFNASRLSGLGQKHKSHAIPPLKYIDALYSTNVSDALIAQCQAHLSRTSRKTNLEIPSGSPPLPHTSHHHSHNHSHRSHDHFNKTAAHHMVFFQTGHWDLSNFGLRYATHAANLTTQKLIQTIDEIFSGRRTCPGIQHLVVMTPNPHPLCYNDFNKCEQDRQQRFNTNLQAFSEVLVKGVLKSYRSNYDTDFGMSRSMIRLSIIDAFSIIAPRIVYNEDGEATCNNHFYCRTDGLAQELIDTPGGNAVIQSILLAMKLET